MINCDILYFQLQLLELPVDHILDPLLLRDVPHRGPQLPSQEQEQAILQAAQVTTIIVLHIQTHDKFVRFEMMLPLAMVLLQVGWGCYLGTEDLLIKDCMQLKMEPKTVILYLLYFQCKIQANYFLFLISGRQWLDDETNHQQTHGQWPGH